MTTSASAGRSRSIRASASRCRIQHSTVVSARTSAERTPPAKAASSPKPMPAVSVDRR